VGVVSWRRKKGGGVEERRNEKIGIKIDFFWIFFFKKKIARIERQLRGSNKFT